MLVATIAKRYRFEASHVLPNHAGKCSRLHGHSYEVELELHGELVEKEGASDEGMVIDFGVVSAVWSGVHDHLDHRHLNEVVPAPFQPPTAEHIAAFILTELRPVLPFLEAVTVWETRTSWARVSA